MTQLDYDLDDYFKQEEEKYECRECGTFMSVDVHYCSDLCFKASMI